MRTRRSGRFRLISSASAVAPGPRHERGVERRRAPARGVDEDYSAAAGNSSGKVIHGGLGDLIGAHAVRHLHHSEVTEAEAHEPLTDARAAGRAAAIVSVEAGTRQRRVA